MQHGLLKYSNKCDDSKACAGLIDYCETLQCWIASCCFLPFSWRSDVVDLVPLILHTNANTVSNHLKIRMKIFRIRRFFLAILTLSTTLSIYNFIWNTKNDNQNTSVPRIPETARATKCEIHRAQFYKCYVQENDIFNKVKYFNQEISEFAERISDKQSRFSCKNISKQIENGQMQRQNGYQLYGYGNKSWNWIFQNKSLIGTREFHKDNKYSKYFPTQRDFCQNKQNISIFWYDAGSWSYNDCVKFTSE